MTYIIVYSFLLPWKEIEYFNCLPALFRVILEPLIVAGWGSEEFAIILSNTSIQGTLVIVERLRNSAQNYPYSSKVTVSIGLASTKKIDIDCFVKMVDKVLYSQLPLDYNTAFHILIGFMDEADDGCQNGTHLYEGEEATASTNWVIPTFNKVLYNTTINHLLTFHYLTPFISIYV